MLTMSQINHIRDLNNCGYRISEISEKTGTYPKTIRKYLAKEDLSPAPPVIQEKPSKLDPFKPVIHEWLDEDKKHWRKQHHIAQRVYERLVTEHGYAGSYSVVQRYLKKCRTLQIEKANMELVWDPGPAQVDFGEADFYEAGKLCRKKYLTVSFPYSNDGYSQVFGWETAECVCQGLQGIFEFIGGVPPLLIFDNATGVGRRAHTIDILTEGGQLVTTHRRAFGEGRTDISDYSTTLAMLLKNSGAWENSGLRRDTPDALRTYMDARPREKLKDCLRIMGGLTD